MNINFKFGSFLFTDIVIMLLANLQDKILVLYHSSYIGIHSSEIQEFRKCDFSNLDQDFQKLHIDWNSFLYYRVIN